MHVWLLLRDRFIDRPSKTHMFMYKDFWLGMGTNIMPGSFSRGKDKKQ